MKDTGLFAPDPKKMEEAKKRREDYIRKHAYIPGITKGAQACEPKEKKRKGEESEDYPDKDLDNL